MTSIILPEKSNNIMLEEWIALKNFFKSTNGVYWHYQESKTNSFPWNFSNYPANNPCYDMWAGIICTCYRHKQTHDYSYNYDDYSIDPSINLCNIQKIVLVNYNLTGSITADIKNLQNLSVLILNPNHLYGTIPEEIWTLSKIRKIGLGNNKISGCISSSIGNLTYLKSLELLDNYLTGSIPLSISNLKLLQRLDFSGNQLRGSIPPSIMKLDLMLEYIDLHGNHLTGTIPDSVGDLKKLQDLYIFDNYLIGSIPSSIGNIEQLQILVLFGNLLTGPIPSSIGNMTQLKRLALFNNHLNGSIPSSLGNLQQMRYLYLYTNHLSGSIPSSFGNMTMLLGINLGNNYLTGSIPSSIGNMKVLQNIAFGSNTLIGLIPSTIGSLTDLTYLALNNNHFSGIPSTVGDLTDLTYLSLSNNQLTGIPSTIGNLKNLTNLELNNNYLTEIPSTIGNLIDLTNLALNNNHLTGIPSAIGILKKLTNLALNNNYLTGIPSTFGNLKELTYVQLNYNFLSGSISSLFGSLELLQELYLSYNCLTGSIYPFVRNLHIETLDINYNYLTGSIPSSVGNLLNLETLDVDNNYLTGTIPSAIGNLVHMKYLLCTSNFLTGSIPSSIGNLQLLLFINLYVNFLTGSMPSSLGNIPVLYHLQLQNNFLTGSIFSSIGNLKELYYLQLFNNSLTGSIPSSVGNLISLRFFVVANNSFTGSIPSSFGNLKLLRFFIVSNNLLTGSIPSSFGNLTELQYLFLDTNFLTGSIPSSFRNMKSLNLMLLYSNRLIGSLSNIIEPSSQIHLKVIQLSDNQLTGSIPAEFFLLPGLLIFDVVGNCLSGYIPFPTICKSKTLSNLVMDGLHTSPFCRQLVFPGSSMISSPYTSQNNLFNKLDPCVFMMTGLQTLHLSGNGLTGSLPSNLSISKNLTDLSLSHNILTGTIPDSFQSKRWRRLDLSFNRFSGTLSPSEFNNLDVNSIVYLEENWLSGNIPNGLISVEQINILNGNIFGCSLSKSDAPHSDPDYSNYSCGSNSFEVVYFIWLGSVGLVVMLLLIFKYTETRSHWKDRLRLVIIYFKEIFPITNNSNRGGVSEDGSYVDLMKRKLNVLLRIFFYLMVFIITVLLTIYTIDGSLNGVYTYQYGWTVSLAFQSGKIAFGLTFSSLFVLMSLFLWSLLTQHEFRTSSRVSDKVNSIKVSLPEDQNLSSLNWIIAPIINVIVVGGVNILYVYLFLNQSSNVIIILQIVLAIFKSFWNGLGYRYLSRLVNFRLDVDNLSTSHSSLQLFIRLVNNIVIPCVVVAFINPECFYNLFAPAPPIITQFNYLWCLGINPSENNICTKSVDLLQITNFNPPYNYSYQCSSRFITYYSPAFVFLCLVDGLVVPLAQLLCGELYKFGVENDKDWSKYLGKVVPRILKIDQLDDNRSVKVERDRLHPLCDSLQLFLNNLTYLGLLMTFGAVFPPLAFSFFITICMMDRFVIFKVDRFIYYAKEKTRLDYLEVIGQECTGCLNNDVIMRSMWMILGISSCFYTLFLFDTLGMSEGVTNAYWVLILMPLVPLFDYIVYRLWVGTIKAGRGNNGTEGDGDNGDDHNGDLEIVTRTNPIINI